MICCTDSLSVCFICSTTPGGSIFSTTPGGTRIYYDRDTMLLYKNSPIAQSPPTDMVCRPGVTCPADCNGKCDLLHGTAPKSVKEPEPEPTHVHKSKFRFFSLQLFIPHD